MKITEYALNKAKSTKIGSKFIESNHYRIIISATFSLVFNLIFAFYYGIVGILSVSLIFGASSVYYLLLALMRFLAVLKRESDPNSGSQISSVIGVMLIVLSIIFSIMVTVSMKYETATAYGTITMITITTFTFTKITAATVTAVKHRRERSFFIKTVNMIRYSEIAVSLLTMQQSMLVSFDDGTTNAVILNAFTGALVCFFILALGIITINHSRS